MASKDETTSTNERNEIYVNVYADCVFLPYGETNNGEFKNIIVAYKSVEKGKLTELSSIKTTGDIFLDLHLVDNSYDFVHIGHGKSLESILSDITQNYTENVTMNNLDIDINKKIEALKQGEVTYNIVSILTEEDKLRINPQYLPYFSKDGIVNAITPEGKFVIYTKKVEIKVKSSEDEPEMVMDEKICVFGIEILN